MAINFEQLQSKLEKRVQTQKQEFATKSLHLLKRPLTSGTKLQIGRKNYEVSKDAFLVIIDEAPGAYWTHPVTYELHEVATGEVHTIHEKYPVESPDVESELIPIHIPDLPRLKNRVTENFPKAGPIDIFAMAKKFNSTSFGVPLSQSSKRHALFFAGMDNMPDFHTDFVIMREVLIDRYGYDPANIVISMGNGSGYTDLPVDYAGDQAGIDAAFDSFATGGSHALGAGDTLFLYTFNHGDDDANGAALCLVGWLDYYHDRLKTKLDAIHCGQLIVAMNQCHSGGFVNDVLATTGPAQVAIMTACREDQNAYPSAGGGSHGYFSAVLAAALNWAFPTGVTSTFPGYATGDIITQDINSDGLVSAEEAWHYVENMMNANHYETIHGLETPQWGVSAAGVGANLYWGLPDLQVQDGNPWWESPDVFLLDPTAIPNDSTADPTNQSNWKDYYHPDTVNRVVARVHNAGSAPARNVTVEFRVMSFGVGGGTTLIGATSIANIDPGQHSYAYVDWFFSSTLVHRCVMVRATCLGDPAQPFGTPIDVDDNQAQRNLDPLFAGFGENVPAKQIITRTFVIQNPDLIQAVFAVRERKGWEKLEMILPILPANKEWDEIILKPRERKELTIKFEVFSSAKKGQKLHFPLEVIRISPEQRIVGGITFIVEIAEGRLEGCLINRLGTTPSEGTVIIKNTKQTDLQYTAKVIKGGRFSFLNIVPGSYKISAESGKQVTGGSVFVEPNSITKKILLLE